MSARIPATLERLAVPIGELRPYRGNPRVGDVAAIARSLEANGQYRPVVVRSSTGEVLAGNHTLLAALELGWTKLAATFVDVDEEQAARIVLVDNRTSDLAGYDDGELARLLESLPDLVGTGWGQRELDRLLDELAREEGGGADRDTEPGPPPAKPRARPGDLWRLGEHRLLCGDSSDAAAVARLFGGEEERAEMVWTDPPYGIDYHDAHGRTVAGDDLGEARLLELLVGCFSLAREWTRPGGALYVTHSDVGFVHRRAVADAGWLVSQVLVWVKNAFVLSRQDYHWQHEPILYGWRPGAAHRFRGSAAESTVIDDDVDVSKLSRRELVVLVRQLQTGRGTTVVREERPHRNDLHPTMKPVGLVARLVANSSSRGDVVYDPFAGSGSTLVACSNLERRCYSVEVVPALCDVIVDRWQRHTGGAAKLERARRARAAV